MLENKFNNSETLISNLKNDPYFKSIAETIPHFLVVVEPISKHIQYINRLRSADSFEKVLGKSIYDFIGPEFTKLIQQKIQDVEDTGKSSVTDLTIVPVLNPKGRVWYRVRISAVYGTDNTIIGLIFLAEDISDIKQKEFENINKNERIKSIINNTNDIICSIDNEYNLVEFNSVFAAMVKKGFGIDMESGMPVLKFTDPNKHERLRAIYKRVLTGENLTDIEKFATINGHSVYNETNYNPIYDADKKVSGINIFSKDITERVKGEKKIKNALNEKEVLLAEIHHRIKNNLAMVSSLLQLQEMNTNNAEVKEALSLSRKRIKSTALIHELLYKSESFQNINMKDYLAELFEHFKINENIQLQLNGDKVALNLSIAMPLGLMLNEIMLNSFKHSYKAESRGQIEIITKMVSNTFIIEYNDFEGSFPSTIDFKNSNTTGLTLIHTFAEQLNGSVELINNVPPQYKIQIPLNENQ